MMTKKTLAVHLAVEVNGLLEQPTAATRHSQTLIPAEAVADYVDREVAIIEGIEAGLADMRAGRVVGHDEAMARIDRTIIAGEARNHLTTPHRG